MVSEEKNQMSLFISTLSVRQRKILMRENFTMNISVFNKQFNRLLQFSFRCNTANTSYITSNLTFLPIFAIFTNKIRIFIFASKAN